MEKNSAIDFDLRYIFRTIYSKWYIVIIMVVLSIGFAFYKGYHRLTTIYEAKTSLIVGNPIGGEGIQFDISNIEVYERFIQTYCALARNTVISEKVADKLNDKISPEAIHNSMVVVPLENTQFINISIVWNRPEQAKEILNTFNNIFITEAKRLYPTCTIQVIEDIKEPKSIVISRRKYFIAAPIAGIILAVLIIFGIELLDNTIKTEDDIRECLNISVIGEVPKEKKIMNRVNPDQINSLSPLTMEAFRTVRTNIEFISSVNSLRSIMVTSGMPGEGKTLTASNLSAVLAQSGKRTVLIDCDLRNPSIHKTFKTSNEIGLTNYLAGKVTLSEVVNKASTDNLFILTSGIRPPNPTELLGSANMKALIRILRNEYDYIVFDTPPVGIFTDAQVIAQISDGCILVADSGSSIKDDTKRARDLIKNVGGKLIGVVLNKIKDTRLKKSYSYYYLEGSENSKAAKA